MSLTIQSSEILEATKAHAKNVLNVPSDVVARLTLRYLVWDGSAWKEPKSPELFRVVIEAVVDTPHFTEGPYR